MSAPKSVVKISEKGVKYTSDVDLAAYTINELSRTALADVGKLITKRFKVKFYSKFKKQTGDAGRATKYKVWSGKNTKYPRVQIGLKTGKQDGFYAYFQEFGTSKTPRLGLLNKTAQENVDEIIKIESQYLSALRSKEEALRNIDENEIEGGAE